MAVSYTHLDVYKRQGAGQHVGSKAVQVGVVVVQAAGFGMIGLFHGCYLN